MSLVAATLFALPQATPRASAAPLGESPLPSATKSMMGTTSGFTAQDPKQIFLEDFESRPNNAAVLLPNYTGTSGERYEADQYWSDPAKCNGLVESANSTGTNCSTYFHMTQALARALGTHAGEDRDSNTVLSELSAHTAAPGGQNLLLKSRQPIPAPGANKFISFGADAGGLSCGPGLAPPLLGFYLIANGVEYPTSPNPINSCTDPESRPGTDNIRVGTYVSRGGVLLTDSEFGMAVRNEQPRSDGNDGAIDNLVAYDSTPTLTNDLSTGNAVAGDSVRLAFTVHNTTENGSKPGWSFSQDLPQGLELAAEPASSSTCDNATVTAAAGGSSISAKGDLAQGNSACQISVNVTAESAGTYVVDNTGTGAHPGLDLDLGSTVTFAAERNELRMTETVADQEGNSDGVADLGESVVFTYTITNSGNAPLSRLAIADADCATTSLAAGESTTCTSPPRPTTQADIDAGVIDDAQTSTATSRLGADISSNPTSVTIPTTPANGATDLAITPVLTTSRGSDRADIGDTIGLALKVVNTGNVTLSDLNVTVNGRPDLEVSCPTGPLAPMSEAECSLTSPHSVSQADVDAGVVNFSAIAQARTPKGDAVSSSIATAVQAVVDAAPALSLDLNATRAGEDLASISDRIRLTAKITNQGNITVHSVQGRIPELGVICPPTALAPGQSIDCAIADSRVTQDDIERGSMTFGLSAEAVALRGSNPTATASADVQLPTATKMELGATSSLAATTTKNAGDAKLPTAGDEVATRYTVTNTGNLKLKDLTVKNDAETPTTCDVDSLLPGEVALCDTTVPLKQESIDAGVQEVMGAATASSRSKDVVAEATSSPAIPGKAALTLTGGASTVGGEKAAKLDDEISTAYSVVNSGNLTVRDLTAASAPLGSLTCDVAELAPGEKAECTSPSPFRVTAATERAGSITITASSEGTVSRTNGVTPATEERAKIASNELVTEIRVRPALPVTGGPSMAIAGVAALTLAGIGIVLLLAHRRRARV